MIRKTQAAFNEFVNAPLGVVADDLAVVV